MKKEAFIWPLSALWAWIGFIPVDRKAPRGVVGSIVNEFSEREQLWLAIAPEGTRAKAEKWKTGFLRIAEANNCKIQMAALDFEHKRIVLGDLYQPTGDNQADIANIKQWYTQFKGKYPDQF